MKTRRVNTNTALIVPAYNEAGAISGVLTSLKNKFKYIVCVNDGSTDQTKDEIEKAGVYLVDHSINMGQGAALQTGIEFARNLPVDYFVTFDADGQHKVEDVISMLTEIKKGDYDIILGSRFLGKTIGMSKSKEIALKLAVIFSNLTSGLKLTDTHNGLRVFNRVMAEGIQITLADMAHASEFLDIIKKGRYRYKEMPVTIEYSDYSKSKGFNPLINAINISFDALLRKVMK